MPFHPCRRSEHSVDVRFSYPASAGYIDELRVWESSECPLGPRQTLHLGHSWYNSRLQIGYKSNRKELRLRPPCSLPESRRWEHGVIGVALHGPQMCRADPSANLLLQLSLVHLPSLSWNSRQMSLHVLPTSVSWRPQFPLPEMPALTPGNGVPSLPNASPPLVRRTLLSLPPEKPSMFLSATSRSMTPVRFFS